MAINTKQMVEYWYGVYVCNRNYWAHSRYPTIYYAQKTRCETAQTILEQLGFTIEDAKLLREHLEVLDRELLDFLASI